LEHFRHDWSVARPLWEPGHHFEWVWLLGEYAVLTGQRVGPEMEALYRSATAQGVGADGLVVDALAPDGSVVKPSHRIWPHCEAIKAAAARGDVAAAEDMAAGLMRHFLDRPFAGGWIDHLSAEGAPLVDYVPASTLYHLVLAASVAAKSLAAAHAHAKTAS
jgi:mannose-6-phosphate isomerase